MELTNTMDNNYGRQELPPVLKVSSDRSGPEKVDLAIFTS